MNLRRAMPTGAGGFTLVEVLIVVAIIGILANIGIPVMEQQLWRARATAVIADFHVFEQAATEYMRDENKAPPNGTHARPAHDFDPYIKGKFKWMNPRRGVRSYIWENWADKSHGRRLNIRYGFSLKSPDPRLVRAIEDTYEGRFVPTVYDKYTFVMAAYD